MEVCKDVPRTLPDLNFFCDGNGAGVTDHYFAGLFFFFYLFVFCLFFCAFFGSSSLLFPMRLIIYLFIS